jgi:hypothetical protein
MCWSNRRLLETGLFIFGKYGPEEKKELYSEPWQRQVHLEQLSLQQERIESVQLEGLVKGCWGLITEEAEAWTENSIKTHMWFRGANDRNICQRHKQTPSLKKNLPHCPSLPSMPHLVGNGAGVMRNRSHKTRVMLHQLFSINST